MYTIFLTFIAVTFAYPYAAYYPYHKSIPNYRVRGEPRLRQFYPGMMMPPTTGAAGAGGAPAGGMMGPGSYIMRILDMFAPGLASNPMMGSMMYGIDGGDWNDLIEGAMKGDYEKITNKIYDGGFDGDFMYPMMAGMGMGGMFGRHAGGAGTAGATGTGSAPSFPGFGGFGGPMSWAWMDMLNKAPIKPVNARLMRPRQEAPVDTPPSSPVAPTHPFGGMGGFMGGMGGFMGAMNNVWSNPMAMGAMGMTLDSSDMQDIMEAYTKGDVMEIAQKTMGKGFYPQMFQRGGAAPGATTPGTPGTGPAAGSGGFFGGMPFFGSFFNPFMQEFFDFESPF